MKQFSLHNSLPILGRNKAQGRRGSNTREREAGRVSEARQEAPAILYGHKSFDICVAITI